MTAGRFGFIIDAKDAASGVVNSVTKSIGDLGKTTPAVNAQLSGLAAKVGGAVAAFVSIRTAVGFMKDGIEASMKGEAAQVGLKYAYGSSADELNRYISSLSASTAFKGSEIRQSILAASKFDLESQTLETLTSDAADWAAQQKAAGNESAGLSENLNLLGRAMYGNIMMLQRQGIAFTEQQKNILKTGTEAQKLGVIHDVMAQKFGGFAAVMGNTYGGILTRVDNQWGAIKKTMGDLALQNNVTKAVTVETFKVVQKEFDAFFAYLKSADGQAAIKGFAVGVVQIGVGAGITAGMVHQLGRSILALVGLLPKTGTLLMALTGSKSEITTAFDDVKMNMDEVQKFFTNPLDARIGADFAVEMDKVAEKIKAMKFEAGSVVVGGKARTKGGGFLDEDMGTGKAIKEKAEPLAENFYDAFLPMKARGFYASQEEAEADFNSLRKMGASDFYARSNENAAILYDQLNQNEKNLAEIRKRNAEEYARRQMDDIKAWESAFVDSLDIENGYMVNWSQTMAGYMGGVWKSATQALTNGLADAMVDGKADADAIARGLAKTMISTTLQLGIQLGFWMLIKKQVAEIALMYGSVTGNPVAIMAGGLGIVSHSGGLIMHSGGRIPRAHSGLSADEVPAVLQRGEFVMRRGAVGSIGQDTMAYMNRYGQMPAGNTVNAPITVNVYPSPGADGRSLANEALPYIIDGLQKASERNIGIIHSRGVYGR